MYQGVEIIGNLGENVNFRFTPEGMGVANFSVATNRRYTDSHSTKREEKTWFHVTCFAKLADLCRGALHKGSAVYIRGRMSPDPDTGSPRIWTSKDGKQHASYEMVAERVIFLSPRELEVMEAAPEVEGHIPF
jgi:single-strand DNA-binding protein